MSDYVVGIAASRAYLGQAQNLLSSVAARQAEQDAAHAVDHKTIEAAIGSGELKATHKMCQLELTQKQVAEERSARARIQESTMSAVRFRNLGADLAGSVAFKHNRGVLSLMAIVGGVLVADVLILVDALNEVLASGEGYTVKAVGAALVITLLTAVLAQVRFRAARTAETADPTDRATRRVARYQTNLAVAGILIGAGAAVLARVYGAKVTQTVDGWGFAFFILLQATFVVTALVGPGIIDHARVAVAERARRDAVFGADVDRENAEVDLEVLHACHEVQREQLRERGVASLATYLREVANAHPSTLSADYLRENLDTVWRRGAKRLLDEQDDTEERYTEKPSEPPADPEPEDRLDVPDPREESGPGIPRDPSHPGKQPTDPAASGDPRLKSIHSVLDVARSTNGKGAK